MDLLTAKYSSLVTLGDGTQLSVRPIRPADEEKMVRFHAALSEATVYKRYFAPLPLDFRIRHERLIKRCVIDYCLEMALVAEVLPRDEIVGVGRLVKSPTDDEAEVAAIVSDKYQGRGIGGRLVKGLIQFAADQRIGLLRAVTLVENFAMQHLLESEGFEFHAVATDPTILEGERRL